LKGASPQCIAFDPRNSNRVYCGTLGDHGIETPAAFN
jgi:hypothetical protein